MGEDESFLFTLNNNVLKLLTCALSMPYVVYSSSESSSSSSRMRRRVRGSGAVRRLFSWFGDCSAGALGRIEVLRWRHLRENFQIVQRSS